MKRIISLFISLVFLSGCSISKTVLPESTADIPEVTLSFFLSEDVTSALEQAADTYMRLYPQVTFDFERYPMDENYRMRLLEKINSDPPDVFSVHGKSDLNYFLENAQPISLPITEITEPFSENGTLYAFPITLYGYGIIYNSKLLKAMGIDPNSLLTLDGLQSSISSINSVADSYGITKAVCTQTDLEETAVTIGIRENPDTAPSFSGDIQTILSAIGSAPADDPATMLADRDAVIYLGSSEIISSVREINPDIVNDFDILPLPVANNSSYIESSDMVAVNKYSTDGKKKVLRHFFNWLFSEYTDFPLSPYTSSPQSSSEEKLLSIYKEENFIRGQAYNSPDAFRNEFDLQTELLRTKEITWGEYIENLSECWEKGKKTE